MASARIARAPRPPRLQSGPRGQSIPRAVLPVQTPSAPRGEVLPALLSASSSSSSSPVPCRFPSIMPLTQARGIPLAYRLLTLVNHVCRKPGFRELLDAATEFPRRTLLGSPVNNRCYCVVLCSLSSAQYANRYTGQS